MRIRLKSGMSLRYNTRGVGRTIVFSHPVAMRAEFWDGVMEQLQDEYRLIAIDTRGHGESDIPTERFLPDDLANDVIEIIRAVGSPPCVMVGCSMGVMISIYTAMMAPEIVRGLVLANSTHLRTEQSKIALQQRADAALQGMPAVLENTLNRWFSPRFMASRADVVATARDWFLDNDPVVHGWSWLCMRDREYGDKLRAITAPVLAIAGSDDSSASPKIVEEMAETFPNGSYFEISGVGHFAPLENPTLFAQLVREFMKDLPD